MQSPLLSLARRRKDVSARSLVQDSGMPSWRSEFNSPTLAADGSAGCPNERDNGAGNERHETSQPDGKQRSSLALPGVGLLLRYIGLSAWIGAGPRRGRRGGIAGYRYGVHLRFLALAADEQRLLVQADGQRLRLGLIGNGRARHDCVAGRVYDLHRGVGQQRYSVATGQKGPVGDIGWR